MGGQEAEAAAAAAAEVAGATPEAPQPTSQPFFLSDAPGPSVSGSVVDDMVQADLWAAATSKPPVLAVTVCRCLCVSCSTSLLVMKALLN